MIYFIQPTDGGPIKIGTTENLGFRLDCLESHYKRPMALLATMPGGRRREREIHRQFEHLRLGRTEQFRPGPDLMDFIDRPLLVGLNPDTVEAIPWYQKTLPIRLTEEAIRWGKIAAGYTGESLTQYASRTIVEHGRMDAEQLHSAIKPRRPKGGD